MPARQCFRRRSGAELYAWRTAMKMPVEWLAEELGVNPKTVRNWEAGRTKMSKLVLRRLEELGAEIKSTGAGDILTKKEGMASWRNLR